MSSSSESSDSGNEDHFDDQDEFWMNVDPDDDKAEIVEEEDDSYQVSLTYSIFLLILHLRHKT